MVNSLAKGVLENQGKCRWLENYSNWYYLIRWIGKFAFTCLLLAVQFSLWFKQRQESIKLNPTLAEFWNRFWVIETERNPCLIFLRESDAIWNSSKWESSLDLLSWLLWFCLLPEYHDEWISSRQEIGIRQIYRTLLSKCVWHKILCSYSLSIVWRWRIKQTGWSFVSGQNWDNSLGRIR